MSAASVIGTHYLPNFTALFLWCSLGKTGLLLGSMYNTAPDNSSPQRLRSTENREEASFSFEGLGRSFFRFPRSIPTHSQQDSLKARRSQRSVLTADDRDETLTAAVCWPIGTPNRFVQLPPRWPSGTGVHVESGGPGFDSRFCRWEFSGVDSYR